MRAWRRTLLVQDNEKPVNIMWKLQKKAIFNWYSNGQVDIVLVKIGFPPELRANLSGNHGRNRECSFSQIRNLLKTNTSRISGLPKKWQTGGRDKCLSAAEPSEFLKVWLIRIPRFCVDDSNSVPNLPLPMKNIGKKAPGSFIHKLYGLRSPDPLHKRVGEPD